MKTSLFQRSTRALSLTDEGRRIYNAAKPAIDAAQDVARNIALRDQNIVGRVTLTTTAAIGEYLIAPRLPAIVGRYPDLQIDLLLTEQRINIVSAGVDIAIRMGALADSELLARRLTTVTRSLVASPAYLADREIPGRDCDLADHQLIVTNPSFATLRARDGSDHPVRWQIAAGNMLVARRLALSGAGLALLPDFLIADDLATDRLRLVPSDRFEDVADAWLVTSRQRYRSPAVRAVINALTDI